MRFWAYILLALLVHGISPQQSSIENLDSLFAKWRTEDPKIREAADREAFETLRPIVTSDIHPFLEPFVRALNDKKSSARRS